MIPSPSHPVVKKPNEQLGFEEACEAEAWRRMGTPFSRDCDFPSADRWIEDRGWMAPGPTPSLPLHLIDRSSCLLASGFSTNGLVLGPLHFGENVEPSPGGSSRLECPALG